MKRDLHTHTLFCDGKNTPEEMVRSAVEKGLDCLGICTHSYVPFDEECCIAKSRYGEFIDEIARLREKYRGSIELLCGVEQDFYSDEATDGFDYVIGSVHYLRCGEEYLSVDNTPEILADGYARFFGGDYIALCEAYYDTVAHVFEKTGCDIIGHFDLVTKFNERDGRIDERDPRYIAAYRKAVDALLPSGKPFEINTGAISRGYRTSPYPSAPIMDYIRKSGGSFILSSDAHSADSIAFGFDMFG
ncbi:MAG: histidinol-phosphatase [Oscillospiraceae bacterium]|nr:histidinol-phosphatase [Oscillospiraceae bacterium]